MKYLKLFEEEQKIDVKYWKVPTGEMWNSVVEYLDLDQGWHNMFNNARDPYIYIFEHYYRNEFSWIGLDGLESLMNQSDKYNYIYMGEIDDILLDVLLNAKKYNL